MLSKLTIIHRADMHMIDEIVVDGATEFIGELRDFRQHPVIAEFLAESEHPCLSMAWTRLGVGQGVTRHRHPLRSMILLCRGRGTALDGETDEIPLLEGDIILVPAGYMHGFRGDLPDGAEGLSIQFEEHGLYEDVHHPKVTFG
jgi:quercetin dioxygenase-like cupin family protein